MDAMLSTPAPATSTTPPLEDPKAELDSSAASSPSPGNSPGASSFTTTTTTTMTLTTSAPAIELPAAATSTITDTDMDTTTTATTTAPLKRKRSVALTPPLSAADAEHSPTLATALHVLATEATALSHITRLYETSPAAKTGLLRAVDSIENALAAGGKLVVCGVGKSGLVGRKTVATFKSLGLASSFLHAAEAVHGDLGDVHIGRDVLMVISFSGRTVELLTLLRHLPDSVTVLALSGHVARECCALLDGRGSESGVLLPAPVHEAEERSFGVAAPTTSTAVAMALGDMLAIAVAERVFGGAKGEVFRRNHPGGAIGARARAGGVEVAGMGVGGLGMSGLEEAPTKKLRRGGEV